ncbi:hypothetical protein KIN20_007213 [Parelaphostrongylus tenuis]|uniref:Uncharacterized protein n=1 Tax=Parelaphostrongylus tenuis TaxID=148309 RepID=A0AAD5QHM7_PARTN|nr:hypothetical protein KIN20_007213 [Parelaphostrongylus tenuis]
MSQLKPKATVPDKDTLQKATVRPVLLRDYILDDLLAEDKFRFESLVTVPDMFKARLHLGHRLVVQCLEVTCTVYVVDGSTRAQAHQAFHTSGIGELIGTLNDNMKWALYGERLGVCIFDLDITRTQLIRALNFIAHIAMRGGLILFITSNRETMLLSRRPRKSVVSILMFGAGKREHSPIRANFLERAFVFQMRNAGSRLAIAIRSPSLLSIAMISVMPDRVSNLEAFQPSVTPRVLPNLPKSPFTEIPQAWLSTF